MTERWVTYVVSQAGRLDHIRVHVEITFLGLVFSEKLFCDPATNLRNLKRICQPVVENVSLVGRHHLSDFGKAPKACCVENAIPISLERKTVVRHFVGIEAIFAFNWRCVAALCDKLLP
jgi:hypothetical protein